MRLDGIEVYPDCSVILAVDSDVPPFSRCKVLLEIRGFDLCFDLTTDLDSTTSHHFDSVELGRIVRGRDHYASYTIESWNQEL